MKKLTIVILCFLFFCLGCSSQHTKPNEIRSEIWDSAIQAAIIIKNSIEVNKKLEERDFYVTSFIIKNLEKLNNLTDEENKLIKNLSGYNTGAFMYTIGTKIYDEYEVKIDEYFSEKMLSEDNIDQDFLSAYYNEQEQFEVKNSPLNQFMSENNITLTAKDVQYDMENNLNKEFVIEGTIELSDYYNYGFNNEKVDFSTFIIPTGGSYKDGWYVYFLRSYDTKLFEYLKENKSAKVIMSALVPEMDYNKNQGNMAAGGVVMLID